MVIGRNASSTAFLGWSEARLCGGVTLINSPYLPLTHWRQLYIPILNQPKYRTGQTLLLCLDPKFIAGKAAWQYAVEPVTAKSSDS